MSAAAKAAAPAAAAPGKGAPVSPAPQKEKEPTEAELRKENEILEAKIAALKQKLGITEAEQKEELAELKSVFAMFDRDNNGYIDKDEFELLAFQCGGNIEALTPDNIAKTFAVINPKGDGKVTFDDFYKWLKSGADLKTGTKGANVGLLRLKLQSKAWLKSLSTVKTPKGGAAAAAAAVPKAASSDAKGKPAAAAAAASPAAASAAKDSKASDAKKAPSASPKAESKLNTFHFAVGKFGDAKAGVYFDSGEDAAAAQAKRDAVSCPEGVPTFAHVDFALKDGFDEAAVGELSGAIDAMIGAVPFGAMPINVHHSHSVDVVDGDKAGSKVLRVTLFSPVDLQDLAAGLMGQAGAGQQAGGMPLKDAGRGSAKFELPFSLADLKDPAFRFTADKLKFRIISEGDIDRRLLAQSEEALQQMTPARAWAQSIRNAMANAMLGFDLTLQFADIAEFLKDVPDAPSDSGLALPPAHNAHVAGPRRRPRPNPLQQMKAALAQAPDFPVAQTLGMVLSQLPMMVGAMGMAPLYEAVRGNVLGLGGLHVQAHDYALRMRFVGLDFGPLLPAAPAGGMPPMGGDD